MAVRSVGPHRWVVAGSWRQQLRPEGVSKRGVGLVIGLEPGHQVQLDDDLFCVGLGEGLARLRLDGQTPNETDHVWDMAAVDAGCH